MGVSLTSFYSNHPLIKNRAENDAEFNQCVDNNLETIDKLFSKVSHTTHKLLCTSLKSWGKKVLQNPVFIIITTSMQSGFAVRGKQKTSATSVYDDDDDKYNERVESLAAKIENSLDRILSRLATERLQTHLSFFADSVEVVICDQSCTTFVAKKNFNLEPNQISADMLGLSHAELVFE